MKRTVSPYERNNENPLHREALAVVLADKAISEDPCLLAQ